MRRPALSATRRTLLKAVGSSLAILGAAGGPRYVFARTPAPGTEPWAVPAAAHPDPRIRAAALAILVPNSFNLQPWRLELVGDERLVLRADLGRRSPECDGGDRQTAISCGTFLEGLRLAAAADGFAARIALFPEGEPGSNLDERPVANVIFTHADPARDPLFEQVHARRSNKQPFDPGRAVQPEIGAALASSIEGSAVTVAILTDAERVARVKDLATRAAMLEMSLPRMVGETAHFTRLGRGEIEAEPSGIAIATPVVEASLAVGRLSRAMPADPASDFVGRARENYAGLIRTAAGFVFVATDGNARRDQIEAGRAWMRLNLKATQLGLGLQPHSHALHTYPEMRTIHADMRGLLIGDAPEGSRVQMLGRVGYGGDVPPTPRRPVEAILERA